MELTQIQGQNPGQKVNLNQLNQVTIWSANWNNIRNPNIPNQAAKIETNQAGNRRITPTQWSPVFINWSKINKSSPIKHGDTISVGNNHEMVLWAHPKWTNLWPASIWQHLWKLKFSWEDIAEITHKMFNFKGNKEILKPLYVLWWVASFLFILTIVAFFKISWAKDDIIEEKKALSAQITAIDDQLQTASSIIWASFYEDEFLDCEEWDYECEDAANQPQSASKTIKDRIKEAEDSLDNLKKEQDKAIKELKDSVSKVTWEWIAKTQTDLAEISAQLESIKKDDIEKMFPVKEREKFYERYKKSIFEITTKLDDAFWDEIEDIKKDIITLWDSTDKDLKALQEFKSDLKKDIDNIWKFSSWFEIEKTNTEQRFVTVNNATDTNQKDIGKLEKKNDSLDSEIKKLQEEINSLSVKLKDLTK